VKGFALVYLVCAAITAVLIFYVVRYFLGAAGSS
jgi:hypothetical protein